MRPSPSSERKLGYDDYAALPDDGRRYEVLDGVLVVSPAPVPWHQTVSRRIQFALYAQLELTGCGEIYDAPIDVILSPHDILQPDLVYVRADQAALVTHRAIEGPPALVVEVLSPSTRRRDLRDKRAIYERCGVERYWVVDPEAGRIEGFRLVNGTYEPELDVAAPGTITCLGATLELAEIFRGRPASTPSDGHRGTGDPGM